MDKIDEQLNNLSLVEVPAELHQSIIRKVNYHKIKPVLFIALALLVFNFLLTVWSINVRLIDADFISMIRDFFDVFSFDFSLISTVAESFFEIISPALVLSAVLSLIGFIYVGKKISIYQFSKI
jgi:hypothetical protein